MQIPERMYTSEVLEVARYSRSTLNAKRKAGEFPDPIDRGRQDIYSGRAVYTALGIIESTAATTNPWD